MVSVLRGQSGVKEWHRSSLFVFQVGHKGAIHWSHLRLILDLSRLLHSLFSSRIPKSTSQVLHNKHTNTHKQIEYSSREIDIDRYLYLSISISLYILLFIFRVPFQWPHLEALPCQHNELILNTCAHCMKHLVSIILCWMRFHFSN